MAVSKKGPSKTYKKKYITRRRKNPSVRPGQQRGELHVLKRVPTKKGSSGGQRWLCECSCGNRITTPQWYLVRKEHPKRHCGCKQAEGNPHKRERGIWYMMHRRCYNETHVAFKHYGGADPRIGVVDRWNKDAVGNEQAWENFIKDMGPAPTKKHTLDRIDPYAWYGPDNCRWATAEEQMNNLKIHWKHPDERKARAKVEEFDTGDDDDE